MGGQVQVSVGEDQTSISGDVLAEYAPQMVRLLADIVQNPVFPASEVDREKKRQVGAAVPSGRMGVLIWRVFLPTSSTEPCLQRVTSTTAQSQVRRRADSPVTRVPSSRWQRSAGSAPATSACGSTFSMTR